MAHDLHIRIVAPPGGTVATDEVWELAERLQHGLPSDLHATLTREASPHEPSGVKAGSHEIAAIVTAVAAVSWAVRPILNFILDYLKARHAARQRRLVVVVTGAGVRLEYHGGDDIVELQNAIEHVVQARLRETPPALPSDPRTPDIEVLELPEHEPAAHHGERR